MTRRFSPALAALLFFPIVGNSTSPVALHGGLSVRDGNLVGEFTGKKTRLTGMSLGSLDSQDESNFWSRPVVEWLAADWGCSMVRATLDISQLQSLDAYRNNPNLAKGKVHQIVQAGIEKGIYVVVSWHEDSLSDHPTEAKAFFEEMALIYGDKPNVLFEPYDGLSGSAYDWSRLRKLHSEILSVVRPYSSNLVIVSTPGNSRESDAVVQAPLADSNVLYSQHLDAKSDETLDRERMRMVFDAKLPLFVNKLSTSMTAESRADIPKTTRWKEFLDTLGVSWCGWSISRAQEGSAALVSSASRDGSWSASDLTPSGAFFRTAMLSDSQSRARIDSLAVPGKIEAKSFTSVGFDHVLRGSPGARVQLELLGSSWAEYVVASPTRSPVRLQVRASGTSAGFLTFKLEGQEVARIAVPAAIAGASADLISVDSLPLAGGVQHLRLEWTSDDTGRLVLDQMETQLHESSVGRKGRARPAAWSVVATASGLEAKLPTGAGPVRIQIANPQGRILTDRVLDRESTQIALQDRGVLVIRMQDARGSASWTLLR